MSPKATDRQAHTFSPVNGSVRPDPAVAEEDPDVDEPVPVEEPLGPLFDSDEPEELPDEGELEDELEPLDPSEEDEDPDPWEEEDGVELLPARGSVYCEPEADPEASAAPAPARPRAATSRQQVRNAPKRPIASIQAGLVPVSEWRAAQRPATDDGGPSRPGVSRATRATLGSWSETSA